MAFDSKKTILLEKTYLYVRASLGFQLEGTSTEKIPTNNGFYRFFVDNLQKAIGNSYVNILYDSLDLTLQCFCSDLYMDELMSSDSSAIEDVVAELKKNTTTIIEFENGVSSALESNHQDNLAISAKIVEFESGVSSALASNHEDNVAIQTAISSLYNSFSTYFSTIGLPHVFLSSIESLVEIDSHLFSKFVHCDFDRHNYEPKYDMYSLKLLVSCNYLPVHSGSISLGFIFNFKYSIPSNIINNVKKEYSDYYFDLSRNVYIGDHISNINSSFAQFGCNVDVSKVSSSREFCYFITLNRELLQVFSSLCSLSFPSSDWVISPVSNEMGNISCTLRKDNFLIPVDLGYHYLSSSYKGWVDFCILDCDSIDLDFIKKCDLYFTFNDGNITSMHLYECNPYLSNNNTILFTNLPSYQSPSNTSKLCGMNLVYTGVSSAG